MIKSVYFPPKGNGYIYELVDEPVKPERFHREYKYCTDEEFKNAQKKWSKEHRAWCKVKNNFKLPCAKYLVDRKFNFEPGKINIIFGANASGKSTIIKAIAGAASCGDGYTQFNDPSAFRYSFSWDKMPESERYSKKELLKVIEGRQKNTAEVEWDGSPVYYHNFSETVERAGSIFGELMNSGIINSAKDEMMFILGGKEISAGQKAAWIFNKLVKVISGDISLKDIVAPFMDKVKNANSTWTTAYQVQYDYYSNLPNFSKVSEKTVLLDEVDINLDIETVHRLYMEVLPRLVNKYGTQIIAVSHSPIILSKDIMENPMYNVISIDESYTNDAKEILKKLTF